MKAPPMISGETRVFGLVGHPVRQSLSPAMHNELFRRHGVDAMYVTFDVRPEDAPKVATAVRTLGLAGVNLTVPFKEEVVGELDELSPTARAAGAVNVVVRDGDRLVGHNTDGAGYVAALQEDLRLAPRDREMIVLGAGGTGRAVAAAAAAAGARRVTLLNRTVARAEHAVDALAAAFPGVRFDAGPLDPDAFAARAPGVSLVVNCTSAAAGATIGALDVRVIAPASAWTDVNYWLSDPPRLAACAAHGIRVQRGIGMLIHQGALSFGLFTGVAVDGDTIRGVLDIGGW